MSYLRAYASKERVRAFLTSRHEEGKRLGEAAQAGYWQFDSDAFQPIRGFLTQLQ